MQVGYVHQSKESLDCQTNSPCQYIGKCIKNSIENIHSEARVYRVKLSVEADSC